jgi:uncharacterized protein (DUF779 family)
MIYNFGRDTDPNRISYILKILVAVVLIFLFVFAYLTASDGSSLVALELSSECKSTASVLHLLREAGSCLDGSSPAFYLRQGTKNKWHVHFEGGGWCFDKEQCYLRSKTHLGSSRNYPKCIWTHGNYLSDEMSESPMMHDWNTVLVKYCDGGSYAGDTTVQYEKDKVLHFRGRQNREETIRQLLKMGMAGAEEVLVSGCSAGGLAVYLGLDAVAGMIHQANSSIIVRGMSDSGFFLDHSSSMKAPLTHLPLGRDVASVNGLLDYSRGMKEIFEMMNISSGADKDCIDSMRHRRDEASALSHCVFAANLSPFISTPMFAVQPQYDQWQIINIIGNTYTDAAVNSYGRRLVESLQSNLLSNPLHGAFVDSCAHHCVGCSQPLRNHPWSGDVIVSTGGSSAADVRGLSPASAFAAWYERSLPLHRLQATSG